MAVYFARHDESLYLCLFVFGLIRFYLRIFKPIEKGIPVYIVLWFSFMVTTFGTLVLCDTVS